MAFKNFFDWFFNLFGMKRSVRLGLYGATNVGKTTLANRISVDFTGEEVGRVSEVPHETRFVQKKEKIELMHKNKKILLNLLDMPGLATKIDYKEFIPFGISKRTAKKRAKEATDGVIEAIKWLNNVDTVLAVMDATQDPLTQVNITLLGNLEARKIPVIVVANKVDKKRAKINAIREAFPQYPVVGVSALKGKNMDELYSAIIKYARGAK